MGWFRHKEEPFYAAPLADFADAVDRLQDGDLLFLRSAWDAQAGPARDAAWSDVSQALDGSDRVKVEDQLEEGLSRWAGGAGRTSLGYATWVQAPGIMVEGDLRRQALPVLWDAGRAILASDLISRQTYDVLIDPWRSLFEDPGTESDEATGEADREAGQGKT